MTPKQAENIALKIKKIKAALATDKRRWGGFYDDSAGLRYAPPALYLKLADYKGGLAYFRWFAKNFPNDIGFPGFLFEWTVVLFKNNKLDEAIQKAFETYRRNSFVFEKFFGKPFEIDKNSEWIQIHSPEYADKYFSYSHNQTELKDFAEWLYELCQSERFRKVAENFKDLSDRLIAEEDNNLREEIREKLEKLKI